MGVQRSTLAQIIEEVRRLVGQQVVANSDISDNDKLRVLANRYMNQLPQRVADLVHGTGENPRKGVILFDMWADTWTSINVDDSEGVENPTGVFQTGVELNYGINELICTTGSATVYLPANLGYADSLYDLTHERVIPIVRRVYKSSRSIARLVNAPAGPPRKMLIQGFRQLGVSEWFWGSEGVLMPAPTATMLPSLRLEGYRMPAPMAEEDEAFPDLDPRYEGILVAGLALIFMTPKHPAYSRVEAQEKAIALQMMRTARIAA